MGIKIGAGGCWIAYDDGMVLLLCEEEAEEGEGGEGCYGDGSGAGLWVSSAVSWVGHGASSSYPEVDDERSIDETRDGSPRRKTFWILSWRERLPQ